VLLDSEIAGQDATDAFFGLHRHEVLLKPAYARLQIGKIKGQSKKILARSKGDLKVVPYSEPVSLSLSLLLSPRSPPSGRILQKVWSLLGH